MGIPKALDWKSENLDFNSSLSTTSWTSLSVGFIPSNPEVGKADTSDPILQKRKKGSEGFPGSRSYGKKSVSVWIQTWVWFHENE